MFGKILNITDSTVEVEIKKDVNARTHAHVWGFVASV